MIIIYVVSCYCLFSAHLLENVSYRNFNQMSPFFFYLQHFSHKFYGCISLIFRYYCFYILHINVFFSFLLNKRAHVSINAWTMLRSCHSHVQPPYKIKHLMCWQIQIGSRWTAFCFQVGREELFNFNTPMHAYNK